jgi:predicted O-linked N-acetylglucosamine transferase (SPINDLY family)
VSRAGDLQGQLRAALEHHRAGRLKQAAAIYANVLKRAPRQVDALHLMGVVCHRLGELGEAERLITRALALKPDFAAAHGNLGNVLRSQGKLEAAAAAFRAATALQPDLAEPRNNLGAVLQAQGKLTEAAAAFEAAIARQPDYADAHGNLGTVLQAQGKLGPAIDHYRRALALRPDTPEILVNLGIALNVLGRLDEAIAMLRRAIALRPDLPEAHNNLACALRDQGQFEPAFAAYRQALALRPGYERAHSNLICAMDWAPGVTVEEAQAERRRWYLAHRCADTARCRDWPNPRDPERKLRLGYVSADFRRHSAAFAFGPVIWDHDRSRFEVVCYSGVTQEDELTARFRASAASWRSIAGMSNEALVDQIRADAIDVLIDLSGHTVGNRLAVFTAKPAPVQVSAWGSVTGTGIPDIDALFADPIMIPVEERGWFAETVIDLPCMLTYQAPDYAPAVTALPAVTEGCVTFGCLNRFAKVSDDALAAWARILAALPTSRLLLKDKVFDDADERARTLDRLARLGTTAPRVLFRGGTDHVGHLAAYGAVDIALDPFPQNGGVTTLEALWMGVPVVSRRGTTPPGRAGAAILSPLGLGDLVARDADDYVARACRLAHDLPALATLRAGLRARLLGSPVGDIPRYVAAVEAAYRDLWRRRCAGSRPAATPAAVPDEAATRRQLEAALGHHGAGRVEAAMALYREILARDPANLDALHLLGVAHRNRGELDDAERCIARAIALKPDFDVAHNNLGNVLRDLGRYDDAEGAYRRAIALQPKAAGAYANLGNLLAHRSRFAEAAAVLRSALALAPDSADAHNAHGVVLWRLGRLDDAIQAFRRAIELDPHEAKAHNNLGMALFDRGALDPSIDSYRQALAIKPDYAGAHSNLIFALDSNPRFTLEDVQAERKRWYHAHRRRAAGRDGWSNSPASERRLRVGYVSGDFRRHSAAFCFGPVLWAHDPARFEVVCYSTAIEEDDFTARFKRAASAWRAVAHLSDDALERLIRDDAIDLLVDLSGHTANNRLTVFTAKPAPVQLTAWGNVSGTGIPEIDYLLADPIVLPPAERALFVEQVIDLPCALSCPVPDDTPEPGPLPALAEGRVTFGCLNRFSKVSEDALALWARIIRDCPASRLLLKDRVFSDAGLRAGVLAKLERLGIAPERVMIQGATDRQAHLAAYRAVDLALDPFPQSGGITSLEALSMGVPVVTRMGQTVAGRMTASILSALGMTAFVARTDAEYIALALERAAQLDALSETRASLRGRLRDSPVGNAARYVAAVEDAYRDAWRRWCATR